MRYGLDDLVLHVTKRILLLIEVLELNSKFLVNPGMHILTETFFKC